MCEKGISIDIQWLPREENVISDYISKLFDFDDWGVTGRFFYFVDNIFGLHTCDRFADSGNKKVKQNYSRFFTPGTAGVYSFSFNWKSENNWLVPPIYLVNKVIKHCLICKAEGTLIVPK